MRKQYEPELNQPCGHVPVGGLAMAFGFLAIERLLSPTAGMIISPIMAQRAHIFGDIEGEEQRKRLNTRYS